MKNGLIAVTTQLRSIKIFQKNIFMYIFLHYILIKILSLKKLNYALDHNMNLGNICLKNMFFRYTYILYHEFNLRRCGNCCHVSSQSVNFIQVPLKFNIVIIRSGIFFCKMKVSKQITSKHKSTNILPMYFNLKTELIPFKEL